MSGIGSSGLDIKSMVDGLVKAELAPLQNKHDKRLNSANTELSAVGQLKSLLSTFKTSLATLSNLSQFNKMKYTISDSSYLSATLNEQAVPGTYQIQVAQLAQAHNLSSSYFASNTTSVGSGTITINFGTYTNNQSTFTVNPAATPKTITIPSGGDNLTAVCDALNAPDTGVKAMIIQDSNGSRLSITSASTGENYAMQITSTIPALNYDPTTSNTSLTQNQVAQNSQVLVNGMTISQSTNQLQNALPGVTLNLQKAEAGQNINLTVETNTEQLKNCVNEFIKKYNDCISFLTDLTGCDIKTMQRGIYQGDPQFRNLKLDLHYFATAPLLNSTSPISSLADLGIMSNKKTGLLEINQKTFDEAIKNNYSSIGPLFAKTISATDPNIKINCMDTKALAGTYDVVLSEYTPGVSMSGTIGNRAATSTDGVTLTGTLEFADLSINVLSGTAGARGQIVISEGLSSRVEKFLDSYLNDKDGLLTQRKSGLDKQVSELVLKDQTKIDDRGVMLQKRYTAQWGAVDKLLTEMQNTSSMLTSVLSNMPQLKNK